MWNAFFIFCAIEQLIFIYLVANCFPILSLNHPFQFQWILTSQAAIVFLDLTLFITLLWIHCHSSSNEWKKWSEMQKKNEKPEKLIMTTHGNTEHYGECNEENVALIHRESGLFGNFGSEKNCVFLIFNFLNLQILLWKVVCPTAVN